MFIFFMSMHIAGAFLAYWLIWVTLAHLNQLQFFFFCILQNCRSFVQLHMGYESPATNLWLDEVWSLLPRCSSIANHSKFFSRISMYFCCSHLTPYPHQPSRAYCRETSAWCCLHQDSWHGCCFCWCAECLLWPHHQKERKTNKQRKVTFKLFHITV